MFDKNRYGRILVPMVTPFKDTDQSVDYDAAVQIAEKLIDDNKADSIILTGTTGEFFSMTFDERVRMFEVLKDAVGDRIPLIAGTGSVATREVIELSRRAKDLGYELAMVVVPYYTKPTQKELYRHFADIADSVDMDFVLYNIPIFCGVSLSVNTVAELSKKSNIVGIKEEAELGPKNLTEYINATDDDFTLYCGDDTMLVESYAQGGAKRVGGVISGGAHLIGDRIRQLIQTFLNGQVEQAAELQQSYLPLYRILGSNGRLNPVGLLKEAMKMIGYNAGVPRQPLLPGTTEEKKEVGKVLKFLNILD
ncbi:MAG: 4-hydroxy-tetrahydrodipicolinate synthase [Planctomycetes bacterium]|nr:4-hydroxy-tetrahydrodipicolinate synthase [Planctomycetota bacterium]